MKKYLMIAVWSAALAVSALTSCRKDLGNYDYTSNNEVQITGINPTYTIARYSNPSIKPVLAFLTDSTGSNSKFSFQWAYIKTSIGTNPNSGLQVSNTALELIATSRNLNQSIDLVAGTYTFYYTVTEKATGVAYRQKFTLTTNTDINDGWMIMSDINGAARVDLENRNLNDNTFTPIRDIIGTRTNIKLTGAPQLLYFMRRTDAITKVTARSIFVGTTNATYIINTEANTFDTYSNLTDSYVTSTPPGFAAVKVRCMGGLRYYITYLLDNQGFLEYEYSILSNVFGPAYNKTGAGVKVNIAPFFAEAYNQNQPYMLLYDIDNKRFVYNQVNSAIVAVPTLSLGAPALFDPGNVGMTLVWMDSSPALTNGPAYALFKNTANQYYLARITIGNPGIFIPLSFDNVTSLATNISAATNFAIDPSQGYLIYSVGSKVYEYDVFTKATKLLKDYGTRSITLMKYQKVVCARTNTLMAIYATKLVICTYDASAPATSGKMELFTVPNLNGDLIQYDTFDGFGRIVDVTYREPLT